MRKLKVRVLFSEPIFQLMHKHIKLKHSPESRVFFTSDFHGKHDKEFVWKSRGFNSREEHWEFWINKTNELVRKQDILFHLGDLLLNATEKDFEELNSRLNCETIYHLWGNHESVPHRVYRTALEKQFGPNLEVYPFRVGKVVFLGDYQEIIVNGQYIVCCHFPISEFNNQSHLGWHFSAHSHQLHQDQPGKALNVGFDYWKKPVDFSELKAMMDLRPATGRPSKKP